MQSSPACRLCARFSARRLLPGFPRLQGLLSHHLDTLAALQPPCNSLQIAVEEALRVREAKLADEVVAVSIGPKQVRV